jgi:hypothetical protein
MSDLDHPPWCHRRRCTATAAPVNGHALAMHRSAPEPSGLTEAYLVQTPAADTPSVRLWRNGERLTLPISEAQGLPFALADLLRQAGVDS